MTDHPHGNSAPEAILAVSFDATNVCLVECFIFTKLAPRTQIKKEWKNALGGLRLLKRLNLTPLPAGSSQTRSLASETQELAATACLPSESCQDPFLKQTDAHQKCRIASLEDCGQARRPGASWRPSTSRRGVAVCHGPWQLLSRPRSSDILHNPTIRETVPSQTSDMGKKKGSILAHYSMPS